MPIRREPSPVFGHRSFLGFGKWRRARIIFEDMKTGSLTAVPGTHIRLDDFDPAFTGKYKSHAHAKGKLRHNVERLTKYQDLLYSAHAYSLLIVLQAMDAAGKDGTIKHVMSGVNPEGCEVFSFKQPSQEELDHDFLWRAYRELPRRGYIGIFNRSYYEEVLVTRVHPELLVHEQLPGFQGPSREFWQQRFQSILDFERHLHRNGTLILKFFLHVSKEEQAKRLLVRMDDAAKNWKFSPADLKERLRWDDYMQAYEDMINHTSSSMLPGTLFRPITSGSPISQCQRSLWIRCRA